MYCPNCATKNLEGARFCRSCGADISLVPQALTGHLPESQPVATIDEGRRGRRHKGEPSMDKAIKNIFSGLGFLAVAIVLSFTPMGRFWWFWMLIPAFATLGGGVAEYVRFKHAQQQQQRSLPIASRPPALGPQPQRAGAELPRRNTAELVMPPPSVTENTTRHLSNEAPTRHIGRAIENPSSKSQSDT
jgi:hypothetical protein